MRGSAAFRASVAPGGVLVGPWVRDELWRRARAVPSLDLRFADDKSLVDATTGQSLVTFTRASSGTFVGSDGVLRTAATDVPRFDHNPITGESLGLLVEEARTNLLLRSEEFDEAYWAKGNLEGTLTANQAVAPDGATTADLYQEDTATIGRYLARSQSFTSGTTYSLSCWAKQAPGATRYLGLILPAAAFGANAAASFTLSGAGSFTISTSGTNTSAQIQAFPNGWYRCTLISQATVTTSSSVQIRLSSSASLAANTYTGDGTSGIYLWGAQLEAGAFPTSYIPTTTAAATRSADVASISGSNFSSWYQANEGTVFADIISAPVNTIAQQVCDFTNSATPTQDRTFARRNTSGGLATAVRAGNVLQVDQSTGVTVAGGGRYRHTFAYGPAVFASTANGVTATESSITTYPTVNQVALGQAYNNIQYLNGTIRRLTFWPVRLANTVLQQITQP
jgi:hypothetical protein